MKESLLRTLVPILYAILVRFGVVNWLGVDDAVLQSAVTLIATGIIYVALRFAETHKAAVGWLLGYASQPSYGETPPNPPVQPYADPAKIDVPPAPGERGITSLGFALLVVLVIIVLLLLFGTPLLR